MTGVSAPEVGFEVEDAGEPKLTPEGQQPPPDPDTAAVTALAVAGWTAEEASALLSALFNIGVMVYGPEWAASPAEFRASGLMAVPLLDRFVPKAVGGPLQTGVGLIAVAGEIAGATARRYPIIKRGPRPIWQSKPGHVESQTSPPRAAPEDVRPPAPEGAAPTPSNGRGRGYTLPPDALKVIPNGSVDASMDGLGYGL